MIDQFKNILVVRTDRIGDVVLTSPALKALRESNPSVKLSLLVTPQTSPLVVKNPDIDEVLIDDRVKVHKGLGGYLELIKEIRCRKFDLAIIFHTKKRTNLLCFLAGIPVRMGYRNNKFGFLLNRPIEDRRHEGKKHEAEYCMDVLKQLGVESDDFNLQVSITESAEQWFTQFANQNQLAESHKLVVIHAGASDPSKCWPTYRFAQLIERLTEQYVAKIVLVGAPSIQEVSKQIVLKVGGVDIVNLTGQTTVDQLAVLLKQADLLISNDSGPVHIAAAFDTPVISIFTRNQPGINPERWRPLGKNSTYVAVPPTEGLNFKNSQPFDSKYLEMITVQQVFEEVDALFKLC